LTKTEDEKLMLEANIGREEAAAASGGRDRGCESADLQGTILVGGDGCTGKKTFGTRQEVVPLPIGPDRFILQCR